VPEQAATSTLGFEALTGAVQTLFWQPIAAAIDEPVALLHVCAHGPMQRLPLGLVPSVARAADYKVARVAAWPGLPYFRLAADTLPESTAVGGGQAAADIASTRVWQVGHDCDWLSKQPLPMAAVEAQLVMQLLADQRGKHGRLAEAAALQPAGAGLVACCHGSQAAQLDSALVLGGSALTVRQLVQQKLGAHMVLLPVCLAGETRENEAGNALGVAAGFLLAGTRVVVASSKSVPDLMIPIFTVLALLHRTKGGLGAWAAATRARNEFATGRFPPEFTQWLAGALPAALSVLHEGGAEYPRLVAASIKRAGATGSPSRARSNMLSPITDAWPWLGDSAGLFSADEAKRQAALASVAEGVLQPKGDAAQVALLRQAMREMAAFINIYGVD